MNTRKTPALQATPIKVTVLQYLVGRFCWRYKTLVSLITTCLIDYCLLSLKSRQNRILSILGKSHRHCPMYHLSVKCVNEYMKDHMKWLPDSGSGVFPVKGEYLFSSRPFFKYLERTWTIYIPY